MKSQGEGHALWVNVKEEMVKKHNAKGSGMCLSEYVSFVIKSDFKNIAFTTSRYKFAMKLLFGKKTLLEIGCNEGFFTRMFYGTKERIVGVDFDEDAIDFARNNNSDKNTHFICCDFLEYQSSELFDSVVSFDVIEHISKEKEGKLFTNLCSSIDRNGIAIIGTPNLDAAKYQTESSAKWHINLYSHERLIEVGRKYFHNAFLFSQNDEMIHTGFYPMAHYLILVGVSPIK